MSTATHATTTTRLLRLRGPSLVRLVLVELRKSLDTRASRWFALGLVLLIVAAAVYVLTEAGNEGAVAAERVFTTPWALARMLLPVLGVLSMTSEWSQRTALTTFALVPRRGRVLVAKLGAVLVLSVVTVLLVGAVAVTVAVVAGLLTGEPVQWHGLARHVGGALIGGVCFMGLGAALGALLQQTAVALVAYFVAPTFVSVVGATLVDDLVKWISPIVAIGRLEDLDLDGSAAPTVVALVLWIVLPLSVGTVRWLRR
ncbi:MAG: ABC transporter permease, partial [Propionibacteriaceae bacterium]